MPKRRVFKKRRELVSDDAKKVWRNGQRSGIIITSDGSGFIACERLAKALNRLPLINFPNINELIADLDL